MRRITRPTRGKDAASRNAGTTWAVRGVHAPVLPATELIDPGSPDARSSVRGDDGVSTGRVRRRLRPSRLGARTDERSVDGRFAGQAAIDRTPVESALSGALK